MSEQKFIKSRILQRIDSEQNWTSVNPILSAAEIVFSRTASGTFMKLGDGRRYLDTPFYQDIKIDENQISSLKFVHISKDEYEQLVATSSVNESTIYFLSGDLDAYGRRIMNVKDATDISDAVNLGQMMAALDSVSSDISDYVPFSEDSAGTKTAVAIGQIAAIPGTNSFAMGNNVAATGINSFAFGNGVSAIGTCSYAEGGDNLSGKSAESGEELLFAEARGYASHAEGAGLAIGRYSHAEGGGNSIIEGFMTRSTAEGGYSHAEGTHTWAKGANSHTEGSNTIVKSSTSHAEGKNNIVSNVSTDISIIQSISYVENRGVNSHVEGQGNFIFGGNSHAEGKANIIYGHNSHVEGEFNIVSGRTSHAAGISADAHHDFTFVWNGISSQPFSSQTSGTFNVNPVGGASGVLVGQKSLAQLIEEGQTSSYSALTIGSRKSGSTIGSPSLAVGATTVASKASIAMGFQCEATANNSLANGQACKAGGAASHAEGYMSETKNQRSHADGYKAITDHDYAYAWNGVTSVSAYHSNGLGTYSINPAGGTEGFYIGNQNLDQVINSQISSKADTSSLENYLKLSSNQPQGLSSSVEMHNGSSIELESGSELNVDTGAQINMRSGAQLNFLNSHSKAVVGNWSQISVRNSDRNLCVELDSKANLSSLSSKADLSALSSKSSVYVDGSKSDLSVVHIQLSDYLDTTAYGGDIQSVLYIVSSDHNEAFGKQIKNVKDGTEVSDAVNLGQMSAYFKNQTSNFISSEQDPIFRQVSSTFVTDQKLSVGLSSLSSTLDQKKADLSSLSSFDQQISAKLFRTEYYCPGWISGEVYKGTAEEPCLYRVAYGGRIWRVNLDHNLTSVTPPPDNGVWTDVTNQYFNLYPGCRAEGFGTLAGGQYSHAEGYRTYAVTEGVGFTGAHAEGSKARAVGDASHAEGRLTLADMHASHAEGLSAHANAQYSHAEGENTKTWARAGHAEGFQTIAGLQSDSTGVTQNKSAYAHAEGYTTTAIGKASHAEGLNSIVSGDYAHAEGSQTSAFGENSHAEGLSSIASGLGSHAEGGLRIASGKVLNTTASGEGSHAEGSGTLAKGNYSHAEGVGVSATNNFAHAEGYYTVASGKYSHAEGSESQARADGSHAEGRYAIAKNIGSHVEGRFAKSEHENVFVWSGVHLTSSTQQKNENYYYSSNLSGSFNVNPVGGINGFFVGTSSLADIMDKQISSKADISSVPKISVDGVPSDIGFIHCSDQEYEQILEDGPLSNVLYLVSSEFNNAYGMQIKNLSAGTDLSDAVNMEQFQPVSADVSRLQLSVNELTSAIGNIQYILDEILSGTMNMTEIENAINQI